MTRNINMFWFIVNAVIKHSRLEPFEMLLKRTKVQKTVAFCAN